MKMTDLRAKARAIFGPAIAEPMPNQPNGAKALQQRANARPIPTYKVGGPVKKMPTPAASAASGNRISREEADEMRFMDMMDKKKRPSMPSPAASAASGNRMAREEGAEMRKMKMKDGGKMPDLTGDGKVTQADVLKGRGVKGFAKGGVQTSSDTARKLATEMGGMKKGGKAKSKDGLAVMIAIGKPMKPAKKMAGGAMGYADGGKPEKKMAGGAMGYAHGGKPVKKMNGGPMAAGSMDREASKVTREMAMGGDPMGYMGGGSPMGYAAGGAGKTRKGQAPIKKAQGGAAKVRKGMMTPEGDIINVMNKMRGK